MSNHYRYCFANDSWFRLTRPGSKHQLDRLDPSEYVGEQTWTPCHWQVLGECITQVEWTEPLTEAEFQTIRLLKEKNEIQAQILAQLKEWGDPADEGKESLFVQRLRTIGLTDAQILGVLTEIDGICHHCWNAGKTCRCWDDS